MFANTKNTTNTKIIIITLSILLFGIFDCINMYKIPSIFTIIYTSLEVDPASASWLMTVYSVVALILAIPAGWLSKKLGYMNILVLGVALSLVGAIIEALTFNFAQWNLNVLTIGRMLEGTCYIFSSVCVPILIQRIVHEKHIGKIMGIWAIRVPLACFIGESLTPVLVDGFSISATWFIYAALVLTTSILMIVSLRKSNFENVTKIERQTNIKENVKRNTKQFFNLALFMVSFLAIAFVQTGILNYVPTILQVRFDINSSISGVLTSLTMIISIPSSLLFGYLCDKFKTYKYAYIIGCALIGPGAFLMFNCYGVLFVVGQVLLGIGLGAPAVSANAVFEILEPKHHSIGIGIGMATFSLGQVLGSSLTQLILDNTYNNVVACGTTLLVIGVIGTILAFLSKTKVQSQ